MHLRNKTRLYKASFGKAVERRVRDIIAADAELNATFSHTGMTRGPGGRFVPSPDFKSKTTGASFDVTTNSGRAAHEKRYTERGERQPTYLLYDVVEGLDF